MHLSVCGIDLESAEPVRLNKSAYDLVLPFSGLLETPVRELTVSSIEAIHQVTGALPCWSQP